MNLEDKIRETILDELRRQAENRPGEVTAALDEDMLSLSGKINLDELVMVIVGSLAGGP